MDDLSDFVFTPWMLLLPLAVVLFALFSTGVIPVRRAIKALRSPDLPGPAVGSLALVMGIAPSLVARHQLVFACAAAALLLWLVATLVARWEPNAFDAIDRRAATR